MPSQTDVTRYAAANPATTKLLPTGRLLFTQTGMEFPPLATSRVLAAYASGRAYARAVRARAAAAYDPADHAPFVVPHRLRDARHFVYCRLTGVTLPRSRDVVERHVAGRRFKAKVAEVEARKRRREELERKKKEKEDKAVEGKRKARERERERKGEAEAEMEEENADVLAGLLSDSEDGGEEEDEEEEDAEMGDEGQEGGTEEGGKADDAAGVMRDVGEDGGEEDAAGDTGGGEVFWTRGRRAKQRRGGDDDNDGDDGDEWNEATVKGSGAGVMRTARAAVSKQSKTKGKKKGHVAKGKGGDVEAQVHGDESGKKRARTEKKVVKKVRRSRQRRRTAEGER